MTIFTIGSVSDWQAAITDSHNGGSTTTEYRLTANLSFGSGSLPYLSTGLSDSNYLLIKAGVVLNGASFTIQVETGCEPSGGLVGILRTVGSSGNNAIVQNINFLNTTNATLNGTIGNNDLLSGCLFISSFSGATDPAYATIQNCIFNTSTIVPNYVGILISCFNDCTSVNLNNLYCASTVSQNTYSAFFLGGIGTISITNIIFKFPSWNSTANNINIGCIDQFGSSVSPAAITNATINNIYVYTYNQGAIINGSANGIISFVDKTNTNVAISNIYIVLNSYNSSFTNGAGSIALIPIIYAGNTTVSNVYVNAPISRFITNNNLYGGTLTGAITNNFLWATTPTFSGSGFNTATTPYRLQSFLASPFDPSTYTSFSSAVSFPSSSPIGPTGSIGIPCFLEGTNILCQIDLMECAIPIQQLQTGDLVKTTKGNYRRVHAVASSRLYNHPNKHRIKNRLYRCTPENYPALTEDLYITGCHGILVKNITERQKQESMIFFRDIYVTDGHYRLMACLDSRAEPYDQEGLFTIWHLALEDEDEYANHGIYANGLLVETMCKWIMHNRSGMTIKN